MGSPGNKLNLETTEQRFEEDIEYIGSKLLAAFDELDFAILGQTDTYPCYPYGLLGSPRTPSILAVSGSIPVGSGEGLRGVRRVFGVSEVLGSLKLNTYLEGMKPSGMLSTLKYP